MFFEFGEEMLSNFFVFVTLCEEVQLCFDLCVAVGARPLLPVQPGLPASTCFSIARLCSLSLYFVKVFLILLFFTVDRYSATVYFQFLFEFPNG